MALTWNSTSHPVRGYAAGSVIATAPVDPATPQLGEPVSISTSVIRVPVAQFPGTADAVDMEISPAGAGTWSEFVSGISRSDPYGEDGGLETATAYDFRARGVNAFGVSAWSSVVTGSTVTPGTAPESPSQLSVVPQPDGTFNATWQNNSDNETGFELEHWDGSTWVDIATPPAGATSATGFTGSFSNAQGQRGFRLRAVNAFGESAPSNEQWVIPQAASAPTAAAISVTSPSTSSLQVQLITPPTGHTSVQLYISSNPSSPGSWSAVSGADSAGDFPVTVSGLSQGNNRWFDFRATNANGTTSSNIVQGTVQTAGTGGALFTDNFDNGNWAGSQNGVSWSSGGSNSGIPVAPSNIRAYSGTHSVRFVYRSGGPDVDATAEKRVNFGSRSEVWLRFRLYIPLNYNHRNVNPNNNKFIAIYKTPYSPTQFLHMNFSLSRVNDDTSSVKVHWYKDGREQPPISGGNVITAGDKGNWIEIVANVKAASPAASPNGVARLWKNGTKVMDRSDIAYGKAGEVNTFDQLYLLGWSNSGYDAQTEFFLDDFSFAASNIYGVS